MTFFTRVCAVATITAATLAGSGEKATASTVYDDAYVYFSLDSSGSLGASGWDQVKTFTNSIVNSPALDNSIIGLNVFSNGIKFQRSFVANQDRSVITNDIDNLRHYQGTTHTRTAVQDGITQFANLATLPNYRRVMFLITDGNPVPASSQNPCALESSLISNDIELHIIGVGNFNPSVLNCLLDDPNSRGSFTSISDFGLGGVDAIFASDVPPVPLPASLPLLGFGVLAFCGLRRRARG